MKEALFQVSFARCYQPPGDKPPNTVGSAVVNSFPNAYEQLMKNKTDNEVTTQPSGGGNITEVPDNGGTPTWGLTEEPDSTAKEAVEVDGTTAEVDEVTGATAEGEMTTEATAEQTTSGDEADGSPTTISPEELTSSTGWRLVSTTTTTVPTTSGWRLISSKTGTPETGEQSGKNETGPQLDIVILLDGSNSMKEKKERTKHVLDFMSEVLPKVKNIKKDGVHVLLAQFNQGAYLEFPFGMHENVDDMIKDLKVTSPMGGLTNTGNSLKKMVSGLATRKKFVSCLT